VRLEDFFVKNLAMIDLAALTVKRAAIPDQSDNRDGIVKIKNLHSTD